MCKFAIFPIPSISKYLIEPSELSLSITFYLITQGYRSILHRQKFKKRCLMKSLTPTHTPIVINEGTSLSKILSLSLRLPFLSGIRISNPADQTWKMPRDESRLSISWSPFNVLQPVPPPQWTSSQEKSSFSTKKTSASPIGFLIMLNAFLSLMGLTKPLGYRL